MRNWKIFQHRDPRQAQLQAGSRLNEILAARASEKTLLLLSGGSAFGPLSAIAPSNLASLTVGMIDERFSQDASVNNFCQLQNTDFYRRALRQGCEFIESFPGPQETPAKMAARLENSWKNWKKRNPSGRLIATLGMGVDGHTAGIMPFAGNHVEFARLFQRDTWAVSYDAGTKNRYPQRVTATVTLLASLDAAVAFVVGPEKMPAMSKLLRGDLPIAELPAMAWRQIKHLEIFTDLDLNN